MTAQRVIATDAAKEFLAEIRFEHGEVLFVQSGGCCDGSSPMCVKKGDYFIGSNDIQLGTVEGAEVWISASLFDIWRDSQLILDVGAGNGAGFSLDTGRGKCFQSKSRLFDEAERALLRDADPETPAIS